MNNAYTKAGTYEYTIKEVKGNLGGVTYDETTHNAVVTVKDGRGQ
jgi:pilin isopeptide linkage protein